jgi:hypothetical protein
MDLAAALLPARSSIRLRQRNRSASSGLLLFITYVHSRSSTQANLWSGKIPGVNDPYSLVAAKHDLVKTVSFGQRVAEEERDDLASYFVETEQWRRVWTGDVDVVFAPKGGGKSAIYSMLVSRETDLFDSRIILAAGENPTGTPAFNEVNTNPPTSETQFINIWKLYFLTLVAQVLHEYDIRGEESKRLLTTLREAGLLTGDAAKSRLVRRVLNYVERYFNPSSVEGTVSVDPSTGVPTIGGKITFEQPTESARASGSVYIDDLYELADAALGLVNYELWIVTDRLDVAFADSRELEENALRALFRTYRDLQPLSHLALKIFLRSDIWKSITAQGFREASHITRELNLTWNRGTLLRLVMQRLLRDTDLCDYYYDVDSVEILSNVARQGALFDRVFPLQVDLGSNKPKTFDWCLARTRDGLGETAPRELIHLLSTTREQQLRRYEIGEQPPAGEAIFDRQALKDALPEVSTTRLTKTLYAEYPALKVYLERLEGQKTHQNDDSLAAIWELDRTRARSIANELVEVGFFERRGDRVSPTYWVPFMYRPALKLIQGSAEDGVSTLADDDQS